MITEMPLIGNSSQILFQTSLVQAFPEDRRTETLLAGKELTCEREKENGGDGSEFLFFSQLKWILHDDCFSNTCNVWYKRARGAVLNTSYI